MADVKISALPAATLAKATDLLAKVDSVGPTTQKLTIAQLLTLSGQILVYTTTDPTTDNVFPADDSVPALAYKLGVPGAIYQWNPNNSAWETNNKLIINSPDGTAWAITIDNAGQLSSNPA